MPRLAATKHYIYVPYKDKEEAKKLGAKWDSESKKWYVSSDTDLHKFSKWQYPQEIDINEVYKQFSNVLSEYGLLIDGLPIMDGKIKRAKVNGDNGSQKSGAYVGYVDGYPAGFIENFKTGQRINWKFELNRETQKQPFIHAKFEAIKKADEVQVAKRANELLKLNEKTATRLQNEYNNAASLQGEHSYLKSKGIEADGLKVDRFNNLLIPLSDNSGKMWSVQRIAPNGNKIIGVIKTKSERGSGEEYAARKKACFYTSAPLDSHNELFVCEGFATAKSVEILLGKPAIMAVDSGNLLSVCEALLEKYPHKHITICADNDMKNKVNVGLNAAIKCKEKYPQIHIVKPSATDSNISDFNDLMRLKGVAVARADIKSQLVAQSLGKNENRGKEIENENTRF